MITIFTVPRPFEGKFSIIQRNAIQSWKFFCPNCEIILFEDEKGTSGQVAMEMGLKYLNVTERSKFGTPILKNIIENVEKNALNPFLVYMNTDIILLNKVGELVEKAKNQFADFLIIGQRHDIDFESPIDFNKIEDFKANIKKRELHHPSAIDYFIFPKSIVKKINFPPFIVGRPFWDGWFLFKAGLLKIPVIDATKDIAIAHQNHPRFYGMASKKNSPEKLLEFKSNYRLLNGFYNSTTIKEVEWEFESGIIQKKQINFFRKYIYSYLILFLNAYPFFSLPIKVLSFPLFVSLIFFRFLKNLKW